MSPKSPSKVIIIVLLFLVAALLAAILIPIFARKPNIDTGSKDVEIKVNHMVDSLKGANALLELKFNTAQFEINSLEGVIADKKKETAHVKQKQYETVRIIRASDTKQLYMFWAVIKPDSIYY